MKVHESSIDSSYNFAPQRLALAWGSLERRITQTGAFQRFTSWASLDEIVYQFLDLTGPQTVTRG